MAVTKPSTPAHWATTGTRVAPSSGEQDSGYTLNQVPSFSKLNYLIGVLFDWIAWINDPDGLATTGLLLGGTIQTGGPEVLHDTATHVHGPSEIGIISTWTLDNASNALLLAASSGTGEALFSIPQVRGSRVKAVRIYCRALGAAASDITATLTKRTAAAGNASVTDANVLSVSPQTSTTTANIQVLTLTPSAVAELAANEALHVKIHGANTAGDKHIYRIEVDVDRVSNAT